VRQHYDWHFEGFDDWSVDQIIDKTGLESEDAKKALSKSYSEPFQWFDSQERLNEFIQLASHQDLKILKGGRFYHLQGNTNKAIPLIWMKALMRRLNENLEKENSVEVRPKDIKLICLGDNQNDIDMLNIADFAVCVRSPVAKFPKLQNNRQVIYTDLEGPSGWNQAVLDILQYSEKQ